MEKFTIENLEFEKIKQVISNYCNSQTAANKIMSFSPEKNKTDIEEKQQYGKEMLDYVLHGGKLPGIHIDGLYEILSKLNIPNNVLDMKENIEVFYFAESSMTIRKILLDKKMFPKFSEKGKLIFVDKDLLNNITNIFDFSTGEILDTASKKLQKIRRQIANLRENINKKLSTILSGYTQNQMPQNANITLRDGRYVVPIRTAARNSIKSLVHDFSSSGNTAYIEPIEVLNDNNEVRELHIQEQEEIARILRELSSKIADHLDEYIWNIKILSEIDSYYALAQFGFKYDAVFPDISDESFLVLKKAKHPLLLAKHIEDKESVIPLDLELGKNFNTIIITGPNAGGKTVSLKTAGLLTLMANSGMPVTAHQHSVIGRFSQVFAVIGDKQSIENDLSSFTSSLTDLKTIYNKSDEESLILVDELGGGTSPEEGSAIASAFLEIFSKRNCKTIITTHYHSLQVLASQNTKIINASMLFNKNELKPMFVFQPGVPGNSYAVEICSKLGFDSKFLQKAKNYLNEEYTNITSLISELEELKFEVENRQIKLQNELEEVNALRALLEKEKIKYKKFKNELKLEAKKEAKEIVKHAEKVLKDSMKLSHKKKIEESKKYKEEIEHIQEKIEEEIEEQEIELGIQKERKRVSKSKIKPQMEVFVKSFQKNAVITEVNLDQDKITLEIDNMTVETTPKDIFFPDEAEIERKNKKQENISKTYSFSGKNEVKTELDLRGFYVDDALEKLEKFLDQAYLAHIFSVRIIHGYGTGRVMTNVRNYLKNCEFVKKFDFAQPREGGTGATIAYLDFD